MTPKKNSQALFKRASEKIPGAVNSPVRAWSAVGGAPIFVARAAGAHLFDADHNRFVDYVGSYGPAIVGHAHPAVVAAVAEQAKAGRGQIVAAMAEAGVGKSRLLFEFKAVTQAGWMVLEAFSVSHGKASAFLPVIDLLYSYFEISSEDDSRKRREKINGKVLTLDRSLEDTLPYLYGLLGITDEDNQIAEIEAQTRKRRALDAIA